MPAEIYKRYVFIKNSMEKDITKVTGKQTKLTMPKVFKAVASPEFNENYIKVDLKKLIKLSKEKHS
jgi:hypothetical protein